MEFSAVASDLADALNLVRTIVPTRTTISLLGNVRIQAKRGGIRLGCTDISMDAVLFEPCEVITDGDTTVNANILYSLVKSLPSKELVTLKMEDGKERMSLSCGYSKFSLCCMAVDGFPVMPDLPPSAMSFTLPSIKIIELFNATKTVTLDAMQERYFLQGVCIHTTPEHLVFVAANGKQFAKIHCDKPIGFSSEIVDAPIVPNAAIKVISTILAAQDTDTPVTLSFTKHRMWMKVGDMTFSAKLIDGKFIEYPQMVPMLAAKKVSFRAQASDLATALNRLKIVYAGTDIKMPVAVIACSPHGGIDIAAGRVNGDNGIDFIPAEIVERMPQFGVSPQLLSELVALWPATAMLNVYAPNPSAPIIITSDNVPEGAQCVMPMNPGGMVVRAEAA